MTKMAAHNGMIYLHLAYTDIPPIINQQTYAPDLSRQLYNERQKIAEARDGIFRSWLQQSGIGFFPKQHADFVACMSQIGAYSAMDKSVAYIFSASTHTFVLNNGMWKLYMTFPEALHNVFGLTNYDQEIVKRSVFFFPLGCAGSPYQQNHKHVPPSIRC